jgi:TolA-binding protein
MNANLSSRPARTPAFRLAALLLLLIPLALPAQVPPEQQAEMLLSAARRAYNEKNYPFARDRFKEFLAKFAGHKDAPMARFGLALSLMEGPERDFNGALEQLNPIAGTKEFPDHPFVLYYLGFAQRGQGVKELALAQQKPQEAPNLQASAQRRFDEASKHFAASHTVFAARVKDVPPDGKELPIDLEWATRARCDQAEMQLRLGRAKEARDAIAPVTQDKQLAKSRYHGLSLYYHGFASFLLKDNLAAGKSLNQLTPFTDPIFGVHARYLMARVHHQDGERAEAAADYEGAIAEYNKQRNAAREALKPPDRFKDNPEEKQRLAELAEHAAPDHIARATFFLGVLLYEDGRFGDAQARFTDFAKQFPTSPLVADVQLRQGFCQVQLKQFKEAIATLQPLVEKQPRLADQALLWIAKAQAGGADVGNPAAYEQALKTAIATLNTAAGRAQQAMASDPEAKARRGEILLEMADLQQLVKLPRDAANTCGTIVQENLLPSRGEELLQRQVTALHLAGDYTESDKQCQRFRETYPKSTLLPAVLFRHAENAYFAALALEKNTQAPNRVAELAKLNDEVLKRYQVIVDKYPDFAHANLARYGLAMGHYRKNDLEKAKDVLESIPGTERSGDLALVPYVLADCLLKLAPQTADDAVTAGKLTEALKGAIEQLEGFVGAAPNGAQTPDALLKLGFCQQRMAEILAEPPEKAKSLAAARAAYEQLMQRFPKSSQQPQAIFERAKVLALAGDVDGAMREMRRFLDEPLRQAPVAPMAVLRLSSLLRTRNNPAEAAKVLDDCRKFQEPKLQGDPERSPWITLLQYHHGVALNESGKRTEARQLFSTVAQQAGNRPEAAEAALRFGQSLREEGLQKLKDGTQKLAQPNLKPEEQNAAKALYDGGINDLRQTIQHLETQAGAFKQRNAAPEVQARMFYEAAWASRTLADIEVENARKKLQQDAWQKLKDDLAKKTPPGQPVPAVPMPEIARKAVPLQETEKKTFALYDALVKNFADVPIAVDARFETAELLSERGQHDEAIKLLKDAIDKEPPEALTEKIRLRLGVCLMAKGDGKGALQQFQVIVGNAKSPHLAQAHYRAGECLLQMEDWNEAVKRLSIFRDQGPFQNVPGVTDRALLRLGHAYAQLKQWEPSRQAHEQAAARFPQSPWVHEARYGMGWALQNKGDYDPAVNAYTQVAQAVANELGARAQLNIGLCRLAQKRYPEASTALLVVPFTYDYPQLNALALLEAARALYEDKKKDQAIKLLERVIRDHPQTEQADAARKRLEELKGS